MRNSHSFIWVSTLAVILAGCTAHTVNINPHPLVEAGSSYSQPQPPEAEGPASLWYESFKDSKLSSLINTALENNLDVRQALARLDQAEALAVQSSAALYPSIDLEASSSAGREDGDGQDGVSRAGAALSWEVDAFGRLRNARKVRIFEKQAAAEDVETVRLALSAEVAEAYFNAVAQNLQLQLLKQQTGDDNKLLGLIQQRFDAGVGTNVEVLQQQSQLAENESLIPPAQSALRVYENRIDVLTGNAPDGADRTNDEDVFAQIGTLPPLGIPSDLLLSRPDLRAAQNRLIASDADIGAAIADRLPRITLNGSHIYSDGPIAGATTSILAGLVQPLLDWGARKAEVERNKALYEERLAAFTQLYLEAIEDTENALYQEDRQREFIARLDARRGMLSKTVQASESIYRQGESDYLPVLDAVQDLRAVERALISERRNLVLLRIQLFRALGGPVKVLPAEAPQERT